MHAASCNAKCRRPQLLPPLLVPLRQLPHAFQLDHLEHRRIMQLCPALALQRHDTEGLQRCLNWPERRQRQQGTAGTAAEQKMPPTLPFSILPCNHGVAVLPQAELHRRGPKRPWLPDPPRRRAQRAPREDPLPPRHHPRQVQVRGSVPRRRARRVRPSTLPAPRPYTPNPRAQPGAYRSDRSGAPHLARPPTALEAACSWTPPPPLVPAKFGRRLMLSPPGSSTHPLQARLLGHRGCGPRERHLPAGTQADGQTVLTPHSSAAATGAARAAPAVVQASPHRKRAAPPPSVDSLYAPPPHVCR